MKLRELRRMADLTQIELAQQCGVSRVKLSLAECGQIELSPNEDNVVRTTLLDVIAARAAQLNGLLSQAVAV